ncbi:2Fe-2S iron-sulfur cluster-binding protein [Brumicola pallidula]|jgi:2Fe-2S ferredoxin|uniref:2Fe-2S ferredoxin n=1 Tax=Brumicola pallidula DSM 14239 = ACAM 615 TaxID=1121922 RepID=K6Y3A4_9ALTE|nr:2Fe-2S iron-sulfur cluster-binding protein [Glaciecola pallidula]GAC27279.1 2Fe-2S ferredoxin [Glaciecola pallidula DSM 14239 = ACAM 615]
MTIIKYVDAENNVTEVEAETGESIMSLAVNNMVDGIVGECGGAQACATCHCYLDNKYAKHFSEMSEMEEAMLESAPQRTETSRLSCQLMLKDDTPDIEVSLPSSQY